MFQDDDVDDIVVKVHGELLRIEGWCARRRYTALGTVLGAGLQTHLGVSPALRVALGLPAPQLINDSRSLPVRNNNKLLRVGINLV